MLTLFFTLASLTAFVCNVNSIFFCYGNTDCLIGNMLICGLSVCDYDRYYIDIVEFISVTGLFLDFFYT